MRIVLLLLISLFLAAAVFSQDQQQSPEQDRFSAIERYLDMQRDMMRGMLRLFYDDEGGDSEDFAPGDDFDDDMSGWGSLFQGMGLGSFGHQAQQSFEYEWKNDGDKRILKIIPKGEKDSVNIDVKDNQVKIFGKVVHREERQGPQGLRVSSSVRSFSTTMAVPAQLDSSKVDISSEDGSILLSFPYVEGAKRLADESSNGADPDSQRRRDTRENRVLKPLKPREGDIQL